MSSGAPQDTGECPPVPQSVCEQAENPGRVRASGQPRGVQGRSSRLGKARRVRPARLRRAMQDPAGDAWESGEFRGDGCWSSPFYCRAAEDRRACRTAGSTGGPLAAILCAQVIEMQGCPRAPGQNRRARPARSQAPSAIQATTAMSSWYAPRAIPSRGPARSLAAVQRRISAISRPLI